MFDSRIVYVAESGPVGERQKRIAIMEADGSNHRFLTDGASTAVTPILSPDGEQVAYTGFASRVPQVRIVDVSGGGDRPLLQGAAISFAPTFSPDSRRLLFSMAANGNTDLYSANVDGSSVQRLTSTPGVDTSASFSPDGSKIVFQSDRSGTPQLYVMNSDGSGPQRRISFGGGAYASPVWSPAGDLIAFTRGGGIGVMTAAGADERLLTTSPNDQEPTWAPNGQQLLFYRAEPAGRRMSLMSVPVSGGAATVKVTPQDGSDPDWSQVQE
jgi:TolB protein